ncbi:MAG: type II secretion system protein [Candidatus Acidiferrales bacterium]
MSNGSKEPAMLSAVCKRALRSNLGMTLLELVMVCAILLILASAALPIARVTAKRQQEAELRIDLREMRNSIDHYKDAADKNLFQVDASTDGYPPDLETLVQGVDITTTGTPAGATAMGNTTAGNTTSPSGPGQSFTGAPATGMLPTASDQSNGASASVTMHVRFLRRIPVDPMTGKAEWGLRAVQDDPDSGAWGGQDVFDVYSLSTGTALDGGKYSDW